MVSTKQHLRTAASARDDASSHTAASFESLSTSPILGLLLTMQHELQNDLNLHLAQLALLVGREVLARGHARDEAAPVLGVQLQLLSVCAHSS